MVGILGQSCWPWRDRLALITQMLVLSGQDANATGFIACTSPYRPETEPRLRYEHALLPPIDFCRSSSWRSLSRSHVVACSQKIAQGSPNVAPISCGDGRFTLIEQRGKPFESVRPEDSLIAVFEEASDPVDALAIYLTKCSGPHIAALLSPEREVVYLTSLDMSHCLCRFRGEGCWFLSPSRLLFDKAVDVVFGPQGPLVEVVLPVADRAVIGVRFDGSAILQGEKQPTAEWTPDSIPEAKTPLPLTHAAL